MRQRKARILALSVSVFLILLVVLWIKLENTSIKLNTVSISSSNVPETFHGFQIAHISDLHNTEIGENNVDLLNLLHDIKPDIIAITGDLVDSRKTDIPVALHFIEEAVKIAPCYYVTGNHEARIKEYDELRNSLTVLGVTVMGDASIDLTKNGESITLLGVNDPSFQTEYLFGDADTVMNFKLQELTKENSGFTVLLSHRPELFDIYVENTVDLVLSGHAHGGQFRIPIAGGLVAPNQGFFPRYDSGLYTEKNTNMIVSRGIGNSIIPFRINNPPEIILIELTTA